MTKSSHRPPLWRILVFVIMVVAYAGWSSSTPKEVGIPEVVIGACLSLFVGMRGILIVLGSFMLQRQVGLSKWAFICFWWLLILPLFWGLAVRQNSLNDIMRDVIPLLYFFLPVFFVPQMGKHPAFWKKMCIWALCTIGISYSIRHFLGVENEMGQFGQEIFFVDINYFPMNPAVLFASTFLLILGSQNILKNSYSFGVIYLLFGSVAFACSLSIIVRGQIVIVLFSVILAIIINGWNNPKNPRFWLMVVALSVVILSGVTVSEIPGMIVESMQSKSENAGILNSRDLEANVVITGVFSSISNFVLGQGWGGIFDAFSSGDTVRYTHNIALYLLLKGGLLGFTFGILYCYITVTALIRYFIKSIKSNTPEHNDGIDMALSFALAGTLFLNLLLEPGFKMLSLGIIMTVLWLAILERKNAITANLY